MDGPGVREHSEEEGELLIARVAGLPASAVEPFGGGLCEPVLRALEAVEADLAQARGELGEHLYQEVAAADPRERRFLLAVRRDCHNGRSLLPHRSQPSWRELRGRMGPAADRVLALEERVASLWEELARVHARELEREGRHLLDLAAHPSLRRGLALSSPSLMASLPRLAAGGQDGRKERRARQSLLRYVSRAALKLSPFSTLTRFTLARMGEGAAPVSLLGRPADGREVSLVRLRRYLVEQVAGVLQGCPPLREALPVELNPSLTEVAPDLYRLLAPARNTGGTTREVPVAKAVVDWLRERLTRETTLRQLQGALAGLLGEEERAGSLLERLLKLGLLQLALPWSGEAPRLEERLLAWVSRFPEAPRLAPVATALRGLVELENSFPESAEPAIAVQALEARLEEAWRAAREAAGLDAAEPLRRSKENEVYEDVLLLGAPQPEMVEASRRHLREILRDVEPWFRLTDLFSVRYELLHTFAALARRRWPGQEEAGALELCAEALPLWPEVRRMIANLPAPGLEDAPRFDPLGLPEIAELHRLRQEVWRDLRGCLRPGAEESRLPAGDLSDLAGSLPPHYFPPLGPCLFLQPAGAAGDLWVLNRVFEGTGRYESRFTPVLPDALRRRYVEPLVARSLLRIGGEGEEAELLDLVSSRGDTLNTHAVQTRRVLALPGEPLSLPPERRVDPGELRVRWAGPLPELRDAAGRRVLPIHLGAAALAYMPPLITFLALFGPGELRPQTPPRESRRQGDVEILDRVVLGRLVLARRRWIVPAARLRRIFDAPPWRALAELDRWRRAQGIPAVAFCIERVRFGPRIEVFKPQYLDLRSPSFCELLEGIVRDGGEALVLEEMLPSPEAFPRDLDGERWAVELQVDSLGLRAEG